MQIVFCLVLFLTFSIKSAEFTFESYGEMDMTKSVVSKNEEYKYFAYTNDGVIITNIDKVGISKCAGIINIIKNKMSDNVLCENKIGEYYYYAKYENSNMDPMSVILKFEIVDATGPFIELLGQKCTAAYYPIEENKYLFKGKCDIPDANFLRMKNFKD